MKLLEVLLKNKWGIALLVFVVGGVSSLASLTGVSIGTTQLADAQVKLTESYHNLSAPVVIAPSGSVVVAPTAN